MIGLLVALPARVAISLLLPPLQHTVSPFNCLSITSPRPRCSLPLSPVLGLAHIRHVWLAAVGASFLVWYRLSSGDRAARGGHGMQWDVGFISSV